ncbi:enoyl-CoA hydratase family protein [Croceicoccus naphthovorans]|uniref:Enoyl-CoA hydratase n=1 Tax=Croceicoccus naphthovorans TaxID=1348774 RepID=A0A0G3XE27_9SPHN|nr:enoyl-CoA hydratase family protein [Croceicoccus naphthovorans]AKM09452.1 enoyl-CoA hydratase [Croceicoccus naphthovorans]MBB3991544.1 enoyl-CoA hydratase [Croceicoccus naphthovorans]
MPVRCTIKDRIAEIVFDHPPVNALDSAGWNAVPDIVTEAARNPQVNCLLIRAEGRGFCGGVDIKEMQAHPDRIVALNRGNYRTFKAIRDAEVPVVCAVHGFVIGSGIGVCGASDTLIASEDAYFSLPEVDRGAMGGASHLLRMFPLHKVRAAFFTGGIIPAQEAYRLGAVEQVVPREELEAAARAFCARIASKSRKALVTAKEALNGLEPRDVDQGYRWEQGFTLEMYLHPDSQTARDAFVETKDAAKY